MAGFACAAVGLAPSGSRQTRNFDSISFRSSVTDNQDRCARRMMMRPPHDAISAPMPPG